MAGGAHVLLDKAAAEMRAGRMDAFAAPVGQRIDPGAADQFGEPAREIAGDEIAGIGRRRPARDQHQRRRRLPAPRRRARAPHPRNSAGRGNSRAPCGSRRGGASAPDPGRAGRVRRRSGSAGCGYRSRSTPRPGSSRPTGWPARYSRGSCRRRCRLRRAPRAACRVLARREGGGDGGGVIGLLRPRLGVGAEQRREALPRLVRRDRVVAGRRRRRALLPFRQVLPDAQPVGLQPRT